MARDHSTSPTDAGRRWAEAKAELLRGEIAARDWPIEWLRTFDGSLELDGLVQGADRPAYREAAHHAAAERWLDLVLEQRDLEASDEEEADEEREAERFLESVRSALPEPLSAERDGTRVFVSDDRGEESPVASLADAWRVVSDWDERYTR